MEWDKLKISRVPVKLQFWMLGALVTDKNKGNIEEFLI